MTDDSRAVYRARRDAYLADVTAIRDALAKLGTAYGAAVAEVERLDQGMRKLTAKCEQLQPEFDARARALKAESRRLGVDDDLSVLDLLGEARAELAWYGGPLDAPAAGAGDR